MELLIFLSLSCTLQSDVVVVLVKIIEIPTSISMPLGRQLGCNYATTLLTSKQNGASIITLPDCPYNRGRRIGVLFVIC